MKGLDEEVLPSEVPNDENNPLTFKPLASTQTGIRLLNEEKSVINRKGNIFVVPSSELLSALYESDSRIAYFDYTPNLEINLDSHWFYNNVGLLLAQQVLKDFPDQEILHARGVACSLNGPIDYGNTHIKDIREIVNTGNEQEGRTFITTGTIRTDADGKPNIEYDIANYLLAGAKRMRARLPEELAENIFPALLVYQKSSVPKLVSYHTVSPSEKSSLMLKAYVLPYLGYQV